MNRPASASPRWSAWSGAGLRGAVDAVTRATGVTVSGGVVLGVGVVAWVVGRLVGGTPLYLVSYGFLVVLAISWVLSRRPLPLQGKRSDGRSRFREGESVPVEVSLTASRRLSMIFLEEEVPPELGEPARLAIDEIEAGSVVSHAYLLPCRRRGVYRLGPLVARWGDPFGFIQRRQVLADPIEVLVHPNVEAVADRPLTRLWEDPPIRPPVSRPWSEGLEFYGMRQYTPGDDLRRVVWRAYARTGQLLVRESEQGITDKITIVVDNGRRGHSRGDPSQSFETGVRAAGSLGVRHLREGYSVTLELNEHRAAGPLRGADTQLRLLDALARADLGSTPLTESITRLVTDPHRDAHIVLVTPRLDAVTAATLRLLLDRGSSVLVVALMWDEESEGTLGTAAALGCQVVEVRPETALADAFVREVGAGRL